MVNFCIKIKELLSIDLRSLALFRIGLALLILADLVTKAVDLQPFYTDTGLLPRSVLFPQLAVGRISIYFLNGGALITSILFLIAGFFAFALLLGWKTRAVTFISWFFLMSLQVRNPIILSGHDAVLRMLLFWSMFLPLGAMCSIDSVSRPALAGKTKNILSLGTIALLSQVIFIYWFAFAFKFYSPTWKDGTAIYYTLSTSYGSTSFGLFLVRFPELLKLLTHITAWFELIGPLLLFTPVFTGPIRIATIFAFFCLQLGFGLCLTIQLFPWVMSVAMFPFIPTFFWDKFFPNLSMPNLAPQRGTRLRNLLTNIFIGLCLIYVIWINFVSIGLRYAVPAWLQHMGLTLYLNQHWSMYANPGKPIWFVISGHLKNGTEIDLLKGGDVVKREKPALVSATFKNPNWKKYILLTTSNPPYLGRISDYGSWLCRRWNDRHQEGEKLLNLEIIKNIENISPPYSSRPSTGYQRQSILKYSCP